MSTPEPKVGLRERKKERTRRLIRHHTLRLIDEQGYAATTVEQIAAACEISPSTFFRYFKNKDEAASADFLDAQVFELLRADRTAPGETLLQSVERTLVAVYAGMSDAEWAEERQRMRIIQATPELRGAMLEESVRPLRFAVRLVAERAGLPEDNPSVRAYAGAAVGGLASVLVPSEGEADNAYTLPETREEVAQIFKALCAAVEAVVVLPPELRDRMGDAQRGDAGRSGDGAGS